MNKSLIAILAFCILSGWQGSAVSQSQAVCKFAPTSRISSRDQAKCFLRQVRRYGNLGPTLSSLPPTLDRLLGLPVIDLDRETLRRYLKAQKIQESEIGGSLDKPVSRANSNISSAELARYFIIHDTSTPNFQNGEFPTNINDSRWGGNNLQTWTRNSLRAHVFVSRTGESVTAVNFQIPWRSTGYELEICGDTCKGLFLGIEMVQPRRSDPQGRANNDAIAPTPGFTDTQLDRLALIYIAASVRRGKWMIPAFHAAIDAEIEGGHDDPQNFNLNQWDERLNNLLVKIRS